MKNSLLIIAAMALSPAFAQDETRSTFRAVDVIVDSGSNPLAAYQVTFHGANGLKIVGIEGGEHSAFAEPPYYDPAAIQNERAIIAAFSTASTADLPKGRTRVATIHLRTENETSSYFVQVNMAGASDGKRIELTAELRERNAK